MINDQAQHFQLTIYFPDSELIILKHTETVFYPIRIILHNVFYDLQFFGADSIFQSQQQNSAMFH